MKYRNPINKYSKEIDTILALTGITVSVLSIVYPYLNKEKVEKVISILGTWWPLPIIIAMGIVLFYFREKWRLSYGYTEVVFGITFAFAPIYMMETLPSVTEGQFNLFIKLVGGLYVMVRGLDNIVKGYREREALYPNMINFLDRNKLGK